MIYQGNVLRVLMRGVYLKMVYRRIFYSWKVSTPWCRETSRKPDLATLFGQVGSDRDT